MPDLADEYGNTMAGESAAGDGTGGFGGGTRRFIQSGVLNGDFSLPPETLGAPIDNDTNPLPYWTLVQAGSNAISVAATSDSAAASGYSLTFTMAANGAVADDCYIEQIAPVNGSRGQSFTYSPVATFITGPTVSAAAIKIAAQYLKADGVTTTGTAASSSLATSGIGANTLSEPTGPSANTTGVVPSDAYYLRIQVGFKRAIEAVTTAETVTLTEVRLNVGVTVVTIAEGVAPTLYGPAAIYQYNSNFIMAANQSGPSGSQPRIALEASTGYVFIDADSSMGVSFQKAGTGEHPFLEIYERGGPGTAAANGARLYAHDNGAGKTQLVVIFQSGAAIVLATEP